VAKLLLALTIPAALIGAAAPPPAILGVAHVRIQTSDLEKARRFYGGLLGYDEIHLNGSPHAAVFRVNGRQRVIVQDGLSPDRDERLMDIGLETADVDQMHERLVAAHTSSQPPTQDEMAGGRRIEVSDPDGHRVQFVQLDHRGDPETAASSGDRRISRRLLHAGLTVRDAAAANTFYRDALGFSEIWRGGRTAGEISWINMRVPEGTDYLEYMLTTGTPDRRQLGTAHHIALLVPSIQDALELVRARTTADAPNHRATPQIGRNNRWQLNVYDPDGTRVEFMEPWTIR
jgi:catechol 2,3-dioxygenase-like lactoylglutathione lyase family enzyme